MADGDTGINALVGAVITIVTTGFVPFAPVLGGGVAGYLQGGDRSAGLRVGVYSGLIAFVPAALVGTLVFGVLTSLFLSGNMVGIPGVVATLGGVVFVFVFVFFFAYVVGLSALGGWLGNYVRHDTDVDL